LEQTVPPLRFLSIEKIGHYGFLKFKSRHSSAPVTKLRLKFVGPCLQGLEDHDGTYWLSV
jgi:hypothetical protein